MSALICSVFACGARTSSVLAAVSAWMVTSGFWPGGVGGSMAWRLSASFDASALCSLNTVTDAWASPGTSSAWINSAIDAWSVSEAETISVLVLRSVAMVTGTSACSPDRLRRLYRLA